MSPWLDLYDQHQKVREGARDKVHALRVVLKDLAEKSILTRECQSRLTSATNKNTRRTDWILKPEPLRIHRLGEIDRKELMVEEAKLTVLLETQEDHIIQMTLMVEAVRRDGKPWNIAVHISEDRIHEKNPNGDQDGLGSCSHALLHCHPDLDHPVEIRVPLPPSRPPCSYNG